ncbi:MAG: 3' terminal RNA ribose 2'-O-methyltransferase Hen1, partial [Pyrinomonadaceae bacterium]
MLLTITTTHNPATDLGYLLHKNPSRIQTFPQTFGAAHVFYPESNPEKCTAALLLDVDTIGLVRGKRGENRTLEHYVNDRSFVASSFLSVAIGQIYRSAMTGKSESHAALAQTAIPLEARVFSLPCRGGEDFLRNLFEPLGYEVRAENQLLDEQFPEWGASDYFNVTLRAEKRLSELLTHLYVLIPVLDNEKHYWVGDEEVEKLLRRGEGWLGSHPMREIITRRYLKHRSSLAREALTRLMQDEIAELATEKPETSEETLEKPLSLNEQRYAAVIAALKSVAAKRILDVGCGEGKLLRRLLDERSFTEIAGMDVSHRALEIAAERLRLERLPDMQRERIKLLHGSLTYRDARLAGFDAACVIEVIEHLDAARLTAFERVLFEFARPKTIILTTPNFEYNAKFETLPQGKFRHADHRFEWTRAEFEFWAEQTAAKFGYQVQFSTVG